MRPHLPNHLPARKHEHELAVLLCSYRGTAHLEAQLDSIAAQSSAPACTSVHDDASGDGTVALARAHSSAPCVVDHRHNVGVVGNFERGLQAALDAGHRYIALADQDDVWHPERLAKGLADMHRLEAQHGTDTPLLVHSDLRMIDESGATIAPSFLAWRGYATSAGPDLAIMLGQCGVMGNTCLINSPLARLALPFPPGLHVHDWWLGLIAELYGRRGFVNEQLVNYRIHRNNVSNSVDALDGGAGRATLDRVLRRDFRLPFMEDDRLAVLRLLLAGDGHRAVPQGTARATIEHFIDYLAFSGGRLRTLQRLLAGNYARPGIRHRLRIAAALLTTSRYDSPR